VDSSHHAHITDCIFLNFATVGIWGYVKPINFVWRVEGCCTGKVRVSVDLQRIPFQCLAPFLRFCTRLYTLSPRGGRSKLLGMGHDLSVDRCRLTECTLAMAECASITSKTATAILMEFPDSHFRNTVISCGRAGVVNRAGSNTFHQLHIWTYVTHQFLIFLGRCFATCARFGFPLDFVSSGYVCSHTTVGAAGSTIMIGRPYHNDRQARPLVAAGLSAVWLGRQGAGRWHSPS
jgi:hypothetical protein